MPNFAFDVFLSHSSRDKAIVRDIAERLRRDGLKVWFDEWVLKPGDSIPAKIEDGLERSRVLVLCMSANAFGSDWAQLESGTFRFRDPLNNERRFLPLRLDDAPVKGSLAQFLYINWLPADREQEYAKLVAACRGELELGIAHEAPSSAENRKILLRQKATQLATQRPIRALGINSFYFYISRDKVKKLEQNPPPKSHGLDKTVETVLSTVGADHGRTTEYRAWAQRLFKVLETMGRAEHIVNLSDLNQNAIPDSGWGYAEIGLKLLKQDASLITLQGNLGEIEVLMSCSSVGFLDFDPNKNEIVISSTNHWFFDGGSSYRFRTHFFVLSFDRKQRILLTSPLYLSLPLGLLQR